MEKEFIPYEQALALKELGFESPYPIGGFQGGKVFYYENNELYYDGRPMYSSDAHSGQLLAPLYQQAFKWFRDKHKIECYVNCYWNENDSSKRTYYANYNYGSDIFYTINKEFETYEEAELECIKKLIEIVKNGN